MPPVPLETALQHRRLRSFAMFLVDTLAAVIGTAILDTTFYKMIPVHSIAGVIRKEWILSILCASFIGFFMYRTWKSDTSKWTWTLPTMWLIFGCFVALGSTHEHSVLSGSSSALGSFWAQLSGTECDGGLHASGCSNFFVFTIPFIRALSYSAGALVSSRLYGSQSQLPSHEHFPNEATAEKDSSRA
jgi:hypothetical protein